MRIGNFKWIVAVAICVSTMQMETFAEEGDDLEIEPPVSGIVYVVGGGRLLHSITAQFLISVGGPDKKVLVVPTATESFTFSDSEEELAKYRAPLVSAGATNLHFLHAESRKQANSKEFVAELENASGIWLCGGNQRIFAERYCNTLTEQAIVKFLNRGGVVAGTSAGAAAMSKKMIKGVGSTPDLGPDEGDGLTIFTQYIVEQHLDTRDRWDRFAKILARNPNFGGIGVCENTAFVFNFKSRMAKVVGESEVHLRVPTFDENVHRTVILTKDSAEFEFLSK